MPMTESSMSAPDGRCAVTLEEDRRAVADETGDLGAVLLAEDEPRGRKDGKRLGEHVHAFEAHGHEGVLQHTHEHGEARVHVDDGVHVGTLAQDARVHLDLVGQVELRRAVNLEPVEVDDDHVVSFGHGERRAQALDDEPVRLVGNTEAHMPSLDRRAVG